MNTTVELELPAEADAAEVERLVAAAFLARDLVNTPANDLGPDALEARIRSFAIDRQLAFRSIVGDELLRQNFPMIHAVGRAAAEAPRFVEFSWGDPGHPHITLVGKGVTFDTGGISHFPSPTRPPPSATLWRTSGISRSAICANVSSNASPLPV